MLLHRNLLENGRGLPVAPSRCYRHLHHLYPICQTNSYSKYLRRCPTPSKLAATCRRLNEFAMAYHFGSVSCYEFCGSSSNSSVGKKCGKCTQRPPFTSFRMFRLSFIYNPPLAVIHCKFSNHFRKEMREVKRSLPALKRMGLLSGRFSVSFGQMFGLKVPTETHAAFFEDLGTLGCKTIDMDNLIQRFYDVPTARTSVIVVFDPSVLTKLSKVTLSECPEQYTFWMRVVSFRRRVSRRSRHWT